MMGLGKTLNDGWHLRRILAILSSLLLILAPFAPVMSAPWFGRLALLKVRGSWLSLSVEGVILIAVGLLAFALSLSGRYRLLWASGLVGLLATTNLLYFLYRLPVEFSNVQASRQIRGMIPLEAAQYSPDLEWGAIALLVGTLGSLALAFSIGVNKRVMLISAAALGFSVCVLLLVGQVVLYYFPDLRYLPSLI